jgi:choline transport protein
MDKKPIYSPEEDMLDRATGDVIELGVSSGDKGYATVTLPESNLKRDMSFLTMMGFGFTISSSWAGLSLSSIVAITQGGTATLLYGILAIALPYFCTALTLAELISVYPTAGGQYHFSSILAPEGWGRLLAYLSGFLSNFAWISSSAGTCMMAANMTVALVVQFDSGYVSQAWHLFLIYQAFNLVSMIANIFFVKRVPRVYEASRESSSACMFVEAALSSDIGIVVGSLAGCFIIPIVCLIRSPTKQDSAAVWGRLDNNTGWSDAMCFITGLVGPGWAICAGLDSTMHLVEEAKSPRRTVSRAIIATVVISLVTAILYMTAIVYCIQDLESVVNTATG